MRLKDRVAIVTGGGRGIGRAYSLRLAAEGAAVVIADIAIDDARQTVSDIEEQGGRALAIRMDVSDPESVERCMKEAAEHFGGIDILVNNAAMFANLTRKSFLEIDLDEWDRVMAVNLRGPFLCARAAFPYMKQRGKGKIINIASGSIFTAKNQLAHYVASKMGLVGLTRALAVEMGRDGVRVNTLSPGPTASGTNERISPMEWLEAKAKDNCLGKVERPEDLAGTIVFLASDDSDFITGQMIVVDGGYNFH